MSTTEPILESVNVGLPKDVAWHGPHGAHRHLEVPGRRGRAMVRRLNIDGDGQGDLSGHGGEQRAVLVYQLESYRHWQEHFGRDDLDPGQFGENFTVDGLPDDEVCIGDRYRIGEAEFEVTQPRVTCYRVGMRLGEPEMPALLVAHHRPGFYLRVITRRATCRPATTSSGPRVGRHAPSASPTSTPCSTCPNATSERAPGGASTSRPSARAGKGRSATCWTRPRAAPAGGPPAPASRRHGRGSDRLRVDDARARRRRPSTSVHLARRRRRRSAGAPAGQFLTLRLGDAGKPAPVRSYSLSSGPECRQLPDQRQAGAARPGQQLRPRRSCGPGALVDVAAPRGEFVLTDDASPVLLISAGDRRHSGAGHAAPAGDTGEQPRRVVAPQHAGRRASRLRGGEAHSLLQSLARAHEHVFYIRGYRRPRRRPSRSRRGGWTRWGSPGSACPPMRPRTCAAPRRSWTTCGRRCAAAAWRRRACTPSCSARCRPSTRVSSASIAARPHQPSGPAGTGPQVTFARSGLTVTWADRHGSLLRARRRLRRPDPLVLPHRRLPHLHDLRAVGNLRLRPRAARAASRRGHPDLLCPTGRRAGPRPVTGIRQDPSSRPGRLAVSRRIGDAARRTPATRTRSRAVDSRLQLGEHVLEAEAWPASAGAGTRRRSGASRATYACAGTATQAWSSIQS